MEMDGNGDMKTPEKEGVHLGLLGPVFWLCGKEGVAVQNVQNLDHD